MEHEDAKQGGLNAVKKHVGRGADINAKDDNGMTPLHMAVNRNNFGTVKSLVDQGADTNIKDSNGRAPLHIAAKKGNDQTVLCLADNGADVNIKDSNGLTPLHVAVYEDFKHTVRYLIEKGGDISIKDNRGMTPLHVAAEEARYAIVEYLIDNGAEISAKDNDGMTPLHVAAEKARYAIAEYLIDKGAEISAEDNDGRTPLHIAAIEGYSHTVESFVKKGANINIKDKKGRTPCDVANERGHTNIVQYLNGGGTPDGVSYYDKEVNCQFKEFRELLIYNRRTPCDVADERGHTNIAQFLSTDRMSDDVDHFSDLERDQSKEETSDSRSDKEDSKRESHDKSTSTNTASRKRKRTADSRSDEDESVKEPHVESTTTNTTGGKRKKTADDMAVHDVTIHREHTSPFRLGIKKVKFLGKRIGEGAFGFVEMVEVGEKIYAGKQYRKDRSFKEEMFIREFQIMERLKHHHIVQYYGYHIQGEHRSFVLIMEYLETNLHNFLLSDSHKDLPLARKVNILYGIAQGLKYLHSMSIIHRDLTATNVLLDSRAVPKISDFGNSCVTGTDLGSDFYAQSLTRNPGTLNYMAPEAQSPHYGKEIDVFSFGHLSLFVGIQRSPTHLLTHIKCDDDGTMYARDEVQRRQEYFKLLYKNLKENHSLVILMKKCLHINPKKRPKADDLEKQLDAMYRELPSPPPLTIKKISAPVSSTPSVPGLLFPTPPQSTRLETAHHSLIATDSESDEEYSKKIMDVDVKGTTIVGSRTPHHEGRTLSSAVKNAKELGVQFIDPVEIISCDTHGCDYYNERHDVGFRIPEGAILPRQGKIDIEFAVAMYGPFNLSDGRSVRRVSPVVWLCVQQDSFSGLQKDVEITIPHFLDLPTKKASTYLRFLKANHEFDMLNEIEFQLKPAAGTAVFDHDSDATHGKLFTRHFCSLCIATLVFHNEHIKYCLGGELSLTAQAMKITFYVCYFLKSCVETVEKQLIKDSEKIYSEKIYPTKFMFTDGMELKINHNELPGWILATESAKEISANQVDFQSMSVRELQLNEHLNLYPPRFVFKTSASSTANDSKAVFTFEGATEEIVKEVILSKALLSPSLPLSTATTALGTANPRIDSRSDKEENSERESHLESTATCITGRKRKKAADSRSDKGDSERESHVESARKQKRTAGPKPTQKQLLQQLYHTVADKWNLIGIYLEIPEGQLNAIDVKQHGDPQKCLMAMLTEGWLPRVSPPPTWEEIAEAVEFVGYPNVAQNLRDKFCTQYTTHS